MEKKNNQNDTNLPKKKRKRNYKKYSYDLKRRVVNDILKGIISKEEAMLKYGIQSRQSINNWLSKYSLLNYRQLKNYGMKESLEEKNKRLQAENEELKNDKIVLNMVIDFGDEKFKTNLRKKHLPQSLKRFKQHRKFSKKEN